MRRFLFVGEKPSRTANARRWTWRDGRLAAKQLFDALEEAGITPEDQLYLNLFQNRQDGTWRLVAGIFLRLRRLGSWLTVVGMGKRVSDRLTEEGIAHIAIVHPAARGHIRAKARYAEHVLERLVERS